MKVKILVTLPYCGTEYIQKSGNLYRVLFQLFQSLAIENTKNHYFFTFHILNSPVERQHALLILLRARFATHNTQMDWNALEKG
jgi:hypothetical protein